VRDAAGALVLDARSVHPGQQLQVQLRDGRVAARADHVALDQES
jgi:hypothetical protein